MRSGQGEIFSFLHLIRGGKVVADASRVVLYCSQVVGRGGSSFTFLHLFCGDKVVARGSQVVAKWQPSDGPVLAQWWSIWCFRKLFLQTIFQMYVRTY